MTDKELADRVDARKRLEKYGYRRVTCEACNGTGILGNADKKFLIECECGACDGKGYRWEAPME